MTAVRVQSLYNPQRTNLEGRRGENGACASCSLINTRMDNVDDNRIEILQAYTAERAK